MNPRRLKKVALMLASPEARASVLLPGLFEKTGSIAMAVGLVRPRLVIDPRLVDEHRTVQEYVRLHEGAHLALGHTRMLAVLRWYAAFVFGSLAYAAGLALGDVTALAIGLLIFWIEAKCGFATVHLRAQQEMEADACALQAMSPLAFASAVKTMARVRPPLRGWARIQDRIVNGRDWQERLARVGVVAS